MEVFLRSLRRIPGSRARRKWWAGHFPSGDVFRKTAMKKGSFHPASQGDPVLQGGEDLRLKTAVSIVFLYEPQVFARNAVNSVPLLTAMAKFPEAFTAARSV